MADYQLNKALQVKRQAAHWGMMPTGDELRAHELRALLDSGKLEVVETMPGAALLRESGNPLKFLMDTKDNGAHWLQLDLDNQEAWPEGLEAQAPDPAARIREAILKTLDGAPFTIGEKYQGPTEGARTIVARGGQDGAQWELVGIPAPHIPGAPGLNALLAAIHCSGEYFELAGANTTSPTFMQELREWIAGKNGMIAAVVNAELVAAGLPYEMVAPFAFTDSQRAQMTLRYCYKGYTVWENLEDPETCIVELLDGRALAAIIAPIPVSESVAANWSGWLQETSRLGISRAAAFDLLNVSLAERIKERRAKVRETLLRGLDEFTAKKIEGIFQNQHQNFRLVAMLATFIAEQSPEPPF